MRKNKLLGRVAIAFASAAVIAGGALTLSSRMAVAEEKSDVTEISKSATQLDMTDVTDGTSEEGNTDDDYAKHDDYIYDIMWNGREVVVVESLTRLQEGDISPEVAIEKACKHIKDMSGVDISDAGYIQLQLTPQYIDESDIRLGSILPMRQYTLFVDIEEGAVISDGFSVTMDAVTGKICSYNFSNSKPTFEDGEEELIFNEEKDAEYREVAIRFLEDTLKLEVANVITDDVQSVHLNVITDDVQSVHLNNQKVGRYTVDIYCTLTDGTVVFVSVDYLDKTVCGYEFNPDWGVLTP